MLSKIYQKIPFTSFLEKGLFSKLFVQKFAFSFIYGYTYSVLR